MHAVTGATGFLGRLLVERLVSESEGVRVLVRGPAPALPANVGIVTGNLEEAGALRRLVEGCRVVFHLAGKAHDLAPGPDADEEFHRVNVEGTARLLEAAILGGVGHFVFVSSVKAMGEGGEECIDESAVPRPATPYGASKLAAEKLVLETRGRTPLLGTVLRLPLVYGPGMKGNLRGMLDAIARGAFPPPPHIRNRRSLASASDVVNALILSARSSAAAGRTYLVTDGTPYSTREIYDAMRSALGLRPMSWAVPRWAFRAAAAAGDAASGLFGRRMPFSGETYDKLFGSACYRNDLIRRELNFQPATTLRAALPEIVRARPAR